MGGLIVPKDSGQSGTARPEPVEVTIPPAKRRKKAAAADSLAQDENRESAV
jgi:hypothetical protein